MQKVEFREMYPPSLIYLFTYLVLNIGIFALRPFILTIHPFFKYWIVVSYKDESWIFRRLDNGKWLKNWSSDFTQTNKQNYKLNKILLKLSNLFSDSHEYQFKLNWV